METKTITTRKLTPSEGCYLTQASLADGTQRIFSQSVYLPESASADDWTEWSEAQAIQWQTEHPDIEEDDTDSALEADEPNE